MATTVSDDTKELKTSSSSSPSSSVTSQGENVTKFGGGGESLPEFLYDEKIASLEDRIRSVTGAQRNTEGDNGEKGEEDFDFSDFDPTDSISSKPLSKIGEHEKPNIEAIPLQPIEEKNKFLKKRKSRSRRSAGSSGDPGSKGQGVEDEDEEEEAGGSLLVRKDQNAVTSSPSKRKKLKKKLSRKHSEASDESRAYGTIKSCSKSRQEMSRKSIFHKKTSCSFTEQQLTKNEKDPSAVDGGHSLSSSEIEDCHHSEIPQPGLQEGPGNSGDTQPKVVYAHKHKVKRKTVACNYAALIADTLNDSKSVNAPVPTNDSSSKKKKKTSQSKEPSSKTRKMSPIVVAATANNSSLRKVFVSLCFPCCQFS